MEIQLSPASAGATYAIAIFGAVLLLTSLAAGYIAWLSARGVLSIGQAAVELRVPFYGRQIVIADLDLAAVRSIDEVKTSEFRPTLRTNGIGLPGYQVGWHKLSNGDRGLVALGVGSRAIAIPTRLGFTLLLGVESAQDALSKLRSLASE